MFEWNKLQEQILRHILELSDCSNHELANSARLLSLLPADSINADNIHYQIRTNLNIRPNCSTHTKRYSNGKQRLVSLAGCRLFSSARVQFSVRLIPVKYYRTEDGKRGVYYGVLGVVQELCSRLIRAEMLGLTVIDVEDEAPGGEVKTKPKLASVPSLKYAVKATDIYHLDEQSVIDFVARSITLPNLKIAAIYFPRMNMGPNKQGAETRPPSPKHVSHFPRMNIEPNKKEAESKSPSLIPALLGQHQPKGGEKALNEQFVQFAEKVIKKTNWGVNPHKLRPKSDIFQLTMPPIQEGEFVDLLKPCGKVWQIHTLTREIKKRVDHHNTYYNADTDYLSPIMKLWVANLCYYQSRSYNPIVQKKRLEVLTKKLIYQSKLAQSEMDGMLNFGMSHLLSHQYDAIFAERPSRKVNEDDDYVERKEQAARKPLKAAKALKKLNDAKAKREEKAKMHPKAQRRIKFFQELQAQNTPASPEKKNR